MDHTEINYIVVEEKMSENYAIKTKIQSLEGYTLREKLTQIF